MQTRSLQGDTVDMLCWRHLGRTAGVTEQTLAMNPGLAAKLTQTGGVLPNGTLVDLPEPLEAQAVRETVRLWD
jgi:phage tail protein X